MNERAAQLAQRGGLARAVVENSQYRHQIFFRLDSIADSLYVFIDGDGSPWTHEGSQPARDPTPRRPLALELAARTPRSTLYVGRPCYFTVRADPYCTSRLWTSDRYSQPIVDSMAATVNRFVAEHGFRHTVVIGYSGGGTLAMLMAQKVDSISAVVTIGANLDVAAWTRWHAYLSLAGSLDPAAQAQLPPSIQQLHLTGGRDLNVPETINTEFLYKLSPEQIWRFPAFDHVCCWVEQWANILPRIDAMMIAAN